MSNLEHNTGEPIILAADTSSVRSSLAVTQGDKTLALLGMASEERRSSNLLSDIDWLLVRLGRRIEEIDLFAVINGPGSFTGLRVGLATMKGFAYAAGRPMIGVTSLETAAYSCGESRCTCIMLDATRGEVYSQFFAVDSEGAITALSNAALSKIEGVLDAMSEFQKETGAARAIFGGEAALAHAETIERRAALCEQKFHNSKVLTAADAGWILQKPTAFSAAEAALCAYSKFKRGYAVQAHQISAFYIRPSEAEIKFGVRRSEVVDRGLKISDP